jgi:glycosyltransferase involved in cell wall biosynthesis
MNNKKIKILFFIGSLNSGGKERRLVELLTYLENTKRYSLILVTKNKNIGYKKILELDVDWISLDSIHSKISNFTEFYQVARKINPDIIHTWGAVQTFTVLPFIFSHRQIKLVNSQITAAPPKISIGRKMMNKMNFYFSKVILSNSYAGIEVYEPPKFKSRVIYNGLNLKRFQNLTDIKKVRKDFEIDKNFVVVMVASFSKNKDYKRFFEVGIALNKLRQDTIFIGVGFFQQEDAKYFEESKVLINGYTNLRAIPGTTNVESLVNACDLGVLFSNSEIHGEGISNSVIEYMALGKPVIANDAGGTREVVNDENGYLVTNETPGQIAILIDSLFNNPEKMQKMGENSKKRILDDFTLSRMGEEFESVYRSIL